MSSQQLPEPATVAALIMTLVRNYGVDTVFGIPGTHNLELYRTLKPLGLRAVTSRHEQGAGYAADAWSVRTGLPGVMIVTSGPGLLNSLSAAGNAFCESRSLVIISPGAPKGAEGSRNGSLHETRNPTAASGAVVEWSRRVETAEAALEAIHEAFHINRTLRPRPVHIEVPLDLLESVPERHDTDLTRPRSSDASHATRVIPETDETLDEATRLMTSSRRPLIIAGGGSRHCAPRLQDLAERLGAPVITTTNGKGVMPETHVLALGAVSLLSVSGRLVGSSDLLIVVGSKLGRAEFSGQDLQPGGRVIRIDIDPLQHGVNLARDVELLGDADTVIQALLKRLPTQSTPGDTTAERGEIEHELATLPQPITALAAAIAQSIPRDAVVTGDSSQISYFGMALCVQSEQPGSYLTTPTYATLGYGLPAAIGAKIATPEAPVIAVLGDGALMFSLQELITAVEQELDLVVVCVDNGGYQEIYENQVERGISPIGVKLVQPDWSALAVACGAIGRKVSAHGDVSGAIADAFAETGVSLVHIEA